MQILQIFNFFSTKILFSVCISCCALCQKKGHERGNPFLFTSSLKQPDEEAHHHHHRDDDDDGAVAVKLYYYVL